MVIHNYKDVFMSNNVNRAVALRISQLLKEKNMTHNID